MKYQKEQFGWGMTIVFTLMILFMILSYKFQLGNNPISNTGLIIIGSLLLLTLLCFYKLTVIVEDKNILLKFGIGIIQINLKPDNITEIRTVKTPFYLGFGIRRTKKGLLYNVQGNKGVQIRYGKNKWVIIGSEEPNVLREVLIKEFGKNVNFEMEN